MSWELAVVAGVFSVSGIFFWLSKSYDDEHSVLKLFLQLLGYAMLLAGVFTVRFVIPSASTDLLSFYDAMIVIASLVTVLIVLYWLFYMSAKFALGELRLAFKGIDRNKRAMQAGRVPRK